MQNVTSSSGILPDLLVLPRPRSYRFEFQSRNSGQSTRRKIYPKYIGCQHLALVSALHSDAILLVLMILTLS